jgi:hypothetical protein
MDGLFNFLSKLKVPTKIVFGALLIVSSQFQVLCKPSLWCRIEIH